MNRRKLIAMDDAEIQAFLQAERTLQVATIGRDGYPHLVAMWYILFEERIAFWTYARSQKAVNLRRDARLTCLVEIGQSYEELRGVQIKGQAIIYDDLPTVQRVGELIWERYTGPLNENTRPMVTAQAAKRIAVVVDPITIALWMGHESPRSTPPYIHADLKLKEKALARTSSPTMKTGRYRPPDKLLAFLEGLGLCRSSDMRERGRQGFPGGRRHNRGPGIT